MNAPEKHPLRALIVDDSALNRTTIRRVLESSSEVDVVDTASDGAEALRKVESMDIDVITLDLEMPRMDGFSFLRVLMVSRPLPVIVVSSHSASENVFRALELGAFDFIPRPETEAERLVMEQSLLQKVLATRDFRRRRISLYPPPSVVHESQPPAVESLPVKRVVAIAASTGGPTAVAEVLSKLSENRPAAVLVAQHMPEKFTTTFAERLNRYSRLRIKEAEDGDRVLAGTGLVCPGRRSMLLGRDALGELRARVVAPLPGDRYQPSADRLFESVARTMGSASVGLVLTGMGTDGAEGARAIAAAGGTVVVESDESAVVDGMPNAVIRAGLAHHVIALPDIGTFLSNLLRD